MVFFENKKTEHRSEYRNRYMKDNNHLQTVDKALMVLKYVADAARPLGVTEISEGLHFSKTATFRFLETLEYNHYLYKHSDGRYEIGPQAMYISRRYRANEVVKDALFPIMRALRDRFNLGVQLCTLTDEEVIVVAYLHSHSVIQIKSEVGTLLPIHTAAAGKLILANMSEQRAEHYISRIQFIKTTGHSICDADQFRKEISEVRKKRYAISQGEWNEHTFAIAVKAPYEGMEDFALVLVAAATIDHFEQGQKQLYEQIQEVINQYKVLS